MAKYAVAHTTQAFGDSQLEQGTRYRVVDSIEEVTDMFLLMSIAEAGDSDKVIPIDLGESYAIMTIEPDEDGVSFGTYFDLEEGA